MMGMTKRERAIRYAEEHRQTHVEWLEYWLANPPTTREQRAERRATGGVGHQRWAIRRYDTILEALRG